MKYELPRDGMAAQVQREQERADQMRDVRGSNNLESAVATGSKGLVVYDPNTGGRAQFFQGRIRFWDDFDTSPDQYGEILVDPGAGINYMRLFPPHSSGTGAENSVTVQGRRPGQTGNVWVYTDGQLVLDADGPAFLSGSSVNIDGTTSLTGPSVTIDTPQLPIYSLPTTSATANMALTTVAGQWTLALVTSSRRYKTNIEPVDLDPASVLAVEMVKYNDLIDMGVEGFPAPDRYGVIAEQAHEHVPEFVPLDEDGEPHAFDYDRFGVVGHQVVLKDHEARIAELEALVAALTLRLDALEA